MAKPQKFTVWQGISTAIALASRAISEVRALGPGTQGKPGEKGDPGPPGRLPIAKEWERGVHYQGDVALHAGSTWQALKDTADEPSLSSEDWSCLASAGRDGQTFHVKGTYNPDLHYKHLDVVVLNGGSFVAKRDDPGACPGDGWQLIASQGKKGEKGLPGDPGTKGNPGPPGAEIVSWRDDVKNYRAYPMMSNGREGPPLDLRLYLEQFLQETR